MNEPTRGALVCDPRARAGMVFVSFGDRHMRPTTTNNRADQNHQLPLYGPGMKQRARRKTSLPRLFSSSRNTRVLVDKGRCGFADGVDRIFDDRHTFRKPPTSDCVVLTSQSAAERKCTERKRYGICTALGRDMGKTPPVPSVHSTRKELSRRLATDG